MKHIVNFSGGWCSFWAAHRTVARHGADNVILLFADVLIEDLSLYVFNEHAAKVLGVPITRVSLEMTPWELFRREKMIANDRFPICSQMLKRDLLNRWMVKNFNLETSQTDFLRPDATVVLGFDATEYNRIETFRLAHPTWRICAPMTEEPLWDKCKMIKNGRKLGLKNPSLYALGFPHNNCGGACVRMGITQAVHLYRVRRQVFDYWRDEETATQKVLTDAGVSNAQFTILKDRRGGTVRPLPLRELQVRIEAGEAFSTDEWGGCGCGGESAETFFELVRERGKV